MSTLKACVEIMLKKLLDDISHNINEFDVKMNLFSIINLINRTLIKIMWTCHLLMDI
jgi:hypothetical protein